MLLSEFEVNIKGAISFVLAQAAPVELARLESIVGTSPATREVTLYYAGLQNPDGGFCAGFDTGKSSDVAATLTVLGQLQYLPPLSGSPMATRAVSYLRRHQATDGSWAGDSDLTALAGYLLVTLDPSHLDPTSRADLWLSRQDGLSIMALGRASALWYRLHGAQSPLVVNSYQQVAVRQMSALERTVWLLAALEVGAGGRYLMPLLGMIRRLVSLQRPDGSWSSDGASNVETTLQALSTLQGYHLLAQNSGGADHG